MHPTLRHAVTLFNRRAYFDCHQTLEDLWRDASADDKSFYEGLIRLATGLHLRFNRRGTQGAVNLLTQGLMRLEHYQPTHQGIDVARLYEDIDQHVNDLKAAKTPQVGLFERWRVPRIRVIE